MLSVSEKIKVILKRRNMTLGSLAEKTNQTRQNLSNKMNRDNFSEKEIAEMASALNCSYSVEFTMCDTKEKI